MGHKIENFRTYMKSNEDHYWFDIGVGSNIEINEHFLVRPQLIFGM